MQAAAIYARISDDRRGTAAGVQRQVDDCRAHATRNGWAVAEVYVDNDISAYSGKPRPRYRAMCADVKAGLRDGVIVWHSDRLHRNMIELEDFIKLMEATGTPVSTVTGSDYDLATTDGRAMARVVGAFARKASEDTSRRIKRKHLELAQAGKHAGGGTRPFGFNEDRRTIRIGEAAIIREAAGRALAGESLRSICGDLNERGVPTVTGGAWKTTVLRTILRAGRTSGQREHLGEIITAAEWDAILTPEQTTLLRALLDDPSRLTRRSVRRYLLSGGLLRCGICDATLVSRPRDDGRRRYICAKGANYVGCGKIAILSDDVEAFLVEAVLYRLDTRDFQRAIRHSAEQDQDAAALVVEIQAAEQRRDEVAAACGRGEIGVREMTVATEVLRTRIQTAKRSLTRITRTTALDGYVGATEMLRDNWMDLPLERQRAIVATILDHVTVGAAVRGRNKFDPARLTPSWRL